MYAYRLFKKIDLTAQNRLHVQIRGYFVATPNIIDYFAFVRGNHEKGFLKVMPHGAPQIVPGQGETVKRGFVLSQSI